MGIRGAFGTIFLINSRHGQHHVIPITNEAGCRDAIMRLHNQTGNINRGLFSLLDPYPQPFSHAPRSSSVEKGSS